VIDDRFHDACGVFGIFAPGHDVARLTYFGLYALQHRGQESAGIAVADEDQVTVIKELGLVNQVFNEQTLQSLSGQHAIGHVRYSTTGSTHWQNSQPLVRSRNGSVIALGHNGNLVNTTQLREELSAQGVRFSSATDTEVITALIANQAPGDMLAAVRTAVAKIRGAFSATVLSGTGLAGFRDPYGVRPLCRGDFNGNPVIASETAAFDIIGASFRREIEPGEIVMVDGEHGLRSERVELEGARPALCIFEFIYFARPDSTMAGRSLHICRQEMGRHLALEAPVEADLVVPVPDTGIPAAIGYSLASGIPYAEGIIKNRYVYRTFIQPDQHLREVGIRMKLNPLSAVIKGKRLVVVDDSIVRGTTTGKIVDMLYAAGATEVHLRISSPPIRFPCFYGIDMATRAELVAASLSEEQIRRRVGATTLHYLSLDGLQESTGLPSDRFCRACFTGEYPIPVPEELAMCKMRFERGAANCVP
jgi:amidophosphoribosyltransferase